MKTAKFSILLILIILIGSACQNEDFSKKNPDVDQFVSILKSGDYFEKVGFELPDFKEKDINRLLFYIKDTTILNQFPTNPVSSKLTLPKILCECIFWTIDGIRLGTKYPSLEPCLIDTTTYSIETGYSRISTSELLEISILYINWYTDYKKNPTRTIKQKNIFENTPYRW
ncbi:MAG: DUF4943 family protein [Paludibacter sp.]|nr:DUF4943 family protein [Paludibacter sp.]